MKKENTLDSLIETEQKKLDKLENRRAEIEKKIRIAKTNIEKYKLMKNSQQFNSFSNTLSAKGISFEEILNALSEGDLLSLQEKIDSAIGEDDTSSEE